MPSTLLKRRHALVIKVGVSYDNVMKCKACLKVKFKCVSVIMYSLVMSLPSHVTFIKTEILKYQQCFNLVDNYFHVYSIHTAPGF